MLIDFFLKALQIVHFMLQKYKTNYSYCCCESQSTPVCRRSVQGRPLTAGDQLDISRHSVSAVITKVRDLRPKNEISLENKNGKILL